MTQQEQDVSTDETRVMIDIETLGVETGAAILSIGAAEFGVDGIGDTFYRSVSLTSCQEAGLELDAETIEWWFSQDGGARGVLSGGDDLDDVLVALDSWLGDVGATEYWANSPSFDLQMLEHAYDAVGYRPPWSFYEERDYRTLKALGIVDEPEQDGIEHNALDDALHQARVARDTLQALNGDGDD